jgi:hypothetical protein
MATTEKVRIPKRVLIKGVEWTPSIIKEKIETSDKALISALLRVYSWQTEDEKHSERTTETNSKGFNGIDAEILSSFAKQWETRGFLSPKQKAIARKKMSKYSRQIFIHHLVPLQTEKRTRFGL